MQVMRTPEIKVQTSRHFAPYIYTGWAKKPDLFERW